MASVRCTLGDEGNAVSMEENTREVSDNNARYIAHKAQKYCEGYCYDKLLCEDATSQNSSKIKIILRGGLKIPSEGLSECVAHGFAIIVYRCQFRLYAKL